GSPLAEQRRSGVVFDSFAGIESTRPAGSEFTDIAGVGSPCQGLSRLSVVNA
ncbi:unnamed protein product, partial [Cladocopium goreaui]